MSSGAAVWGRLLAIGAKEKEAYRRIEIDKVELAIGRKETCQERISDNTVSTVHCRITLKRAGHVPDEPLAFYGCDDDGFDDDEDMPPRSRTEVWIEDCSSNGTFVNSQKLGKGSRVRLAQNDEIGLIRACGGAERPPYAFIFQDFSAELEPHELMALLNPSAAVTAPPTPRGGAMDSAADGAAAAPACPPVDLALGPASGAAASVTPLPLGKLAVPELQERDPGGDQPYGMNYPPPDSVHASMQILATPNPEGLRELRGTMRRGQMDIGAFVAADGASALLDVIAEVQAKPKLGWIDLEVLDGALGALKELMTAEDGTRSLLETEGALDGIVGLLGVGEVRVLLKALSMLSTLVVCTDKPLVESALRRSNRYGGASVGAVLCGKLRGEVEAGVAREVLKLLNALIACSLSSEALVVRPLPPAPCTMPNAQ